MRKYLFPLSLTLAEIFGNALVAAPPDWSPRIIQDPKTKVLYYMESDQRHLAAISPDGNLLWCRQVMPKPYKGRIEKFCDFEFWKPDNWAIIEGKGEDCIVVHAFAGTMLTLVINKQTGEIVDGIGH